MVVTAQSSEGDNETIRHQNPDEYDDEGDRDSLSNFLSDELSSRLGESSTAISERNYEHARAVLGEEYDERLEQYVALEEGAETDSGDGGDSQADGENRSDESQDERANHTYADVASTQSEFVELIEEYDELEQEYGQAYDDGDIDTARTTARDLSTLADEIDSTTAELVELYTTLEAETDREISDERAAIEETNDEIQRTQADIEDDVFVETALEVTTADKAGSFLDPLELTGWLEADDGSVEQGDRIAIEIEDDVYHPTLDHDGSFELTHRPVDIPPSADSLTVSYAPSTNSTHLGSETTVPVAIERTTPEIEIDQHTSQVAFGESSTVNGTITAGDIGIDDRTLAVRLGGESIGEISSHDGAFDDSLTVPASVPAGDVDLEVVYDDDDSSFEATTQTESVTVEETPTDLDIEADPSEETIEVTGSLETAAGEPVPDQSVELFRENESVTTVSTNNDGEFTATVSMPSTATDEFAISALFDGAESNLETAETETTVSVASSGSAIPSSLWIGIGAGGLLVIIATGYIWYRRRRVGDGAVQVPTHQSSENEFEPAQTVRKETTTTASAQLTWSSKALEKEDTDDAVEAAYLAVRRELGGAFEDNAQLTHWEFYRRFQAQAGDERVSSTLQELTALYERAAFAVERCSIDDAELALERAREVVGEPARSTPHADD